MEIPERGLIEVYERTTPQENVDKFHELLKNTNKLSPAIRHLGKTRFTIYDREYVRPR